MKAVSAGFLIKTPSGYLQCHPTGKKLEGDCYDIPKGHIEEGEDPYDTAVRELREETGLNLDRFGNGSIEIWPCDIKRSVDFGRFPYNPRKDLWIFYMELSFTPDITKMKCVSTFTSPEGKEIPEMNGYRYSQTIDGYFKNLQKVIEKIRKKDNSI